MLKYKDNHAITNLKITPSITPTIIIPNTICRTTRCPFFLTFFFGGMGERHVFGSLTGRGSGGAGLSAGKTRGLGLIIGGNNTGGGGKVITGYLGGGGGGGGGVGINIGTAT